MSSKSRSPSWSLSGLLSERRYLVHCTPLPIRLQMCGCLLFDLEPSRHCSGQQCTIVPNTAQLLAQELEKKNMWLPSSQDRPQGCPRAFSGHFLSRDGPRKHFPCSVPESRQVRFSPCVVQIGHFVLHTRRPIRGRGINGNGRSSPRARRQS